MAENEREGYTRIAQTPANKPLPTINTFETDEKPNEEHKSGLHWKAPTLLACSLLLGLVCSVGHHFFYRYWDGRIVGGATQQEWIVRGGTFFAFAFKVSLAAGGGVAYCQFLWLSLSRRSYRIRDVDNMFSVLSNPLAFQALKLWAKLPLLTVIAALVWSVFLTAGPHLYYALTHV